MSKTGMSSNYLPDVRKTIPQRVEFEEGVLGALLLERNAWHNVEDILIADCFYKDQHKLIFTAIKSLHAQNKPVDILTVTNELRSTGKLEIVGGAYYISELTNRVTSAANIEVWAMEIISAYQLRELISIGSNINLSAYREDADPFTILSETEMQINTAFINKISTGTKSIQELTFEVQNEISAAYNSDWNAVQGISTGFEAFDQTFGGLEPSNLIILAARPGMGKTSWAMNIAVSNAMKGIPTAVFSMEMSAGQLIKRIISGKIHVSYEEISKGHLKQVQYDEAQQMAALIAQWPMHITDCSLSIAELRQRARRWYRIHGIQLIVIDYLQLIRSDERAKNGNREQEISYISNSLKALAKELNIPILALAQLSRQVEQRGGSKRPILSDLRESGSIEQDADQVFFIYRPEYYNIAEMEDGMPTAGIAEIISAKNRHGRTGTISLHFEAKYTTFSDLSTPF
jgi:replicative DNA helicase